MTDPIDMEILAECIVLKEKRFSKISFFITLLDKHFSGNYEPYNDIKKEIINRFDIEPGLPHEILGFIND
jgi:hypothetical protein